MTKKNVFTFLLILLLVANVNAQENWDVTIRNNYGDADEIGYTAYSTVTKFTAPIERQLWENNSYKVQAYDNQDDGKYIFNDTEAPDNKSFWRVDNPGDGFSVPCSTALYQFTATTTLFTVPEPFITAHLRSYRDASFENDFSGTSDGGSMIIKSTSYSLPTSAFEVVEENDISVMAYNRQTIDGIEYTFEKWDDNNTSLSRSFTVSSTMTYTAEYTGKPAFDTQESDLSFNSYSPRPGADNRVKLTWDEHSNTAITKYAIWRKGKDSSGVDFDDGKIAEVNRGTTTYTDSDYFRTATWTDATLQYAVRAYYSTEATWSDLDYKTTYAEENSASKKIEYEEFASNHLKEYRISNYPNPFNPSTTIQYSIPVVEALSKPGVFSGASNGLVLNPTEGQPVTLKVYDILGREVATLVNEHKKSGSYEINFNASNLSSGVYFYTLQVNDFMDSRKMLLIK